MHSVMHNWFDPLIVLFPVSAINETELVTLSDAK